MITTVYLIRHSEKMRIPMLSTPVKSDRIQPLNVNGERKARALLETAELRNADIAFSSPFARTISTLRYLLEADSVPLELDDRLKELEFGPMKPEPGMPPMGPKPGEKPQHPPRDPNSFQARQWVDRDLARGDGESINQCAARMNEVIREIVLKHPGRRILAGSHGAAICAYLSIFLPEIGDEYTGNLPQPAAFRLEFDVNEAEGTVSAPQITRLDLGDIY